MNIDPARMFMLGYDGETPPPEIVNLIRERRIAGVILFKRNCGTLEGVSRLCSEIRTAAGYPILIGIDQEGGRVSRLPPPFPALPSMRELAAKHSPEELEQIAYEQGSALLKLGINLNFAPVMDADTNPANPVIGDRSFSSDPQKVAEYGTAYIRGLQKAGVAACAKHFPGHGDTDLDSHIALPFVKRYKKSLYEVEIPPFRAAIQAGVASIMSAHVVYEALEERLPATMSDKIIDGILRKELNFNGVVFTDDLLMSAVKERYDWLEVINSAILAGADIMLICKYDAARISFAINEAELIYEGQNRHIIEAACARVEKLAAEYDPLS